MIDRPKIYKMRVRYKRDGGFTQSVSNAAVRDIVRASGLPYEEIEKDGEIRPRVIFGPALGLNQSSEAEYFDLFLTDFVDESDAVEKLRKTKKENLEIMEAKRVPYSFPSIDSLFDAAEYFVSGIENYNPPPLEDFLKQEKLAVEIARDNGFETLDIRPFIHTAAREHGGLKLIIRSVNRRTLKAELFLAKWLCPAGTGGELTELDVKIVKKSLYYQNSLGGLTEI